jgi:hypothetical protein
MAQYEGVHTARGLRAEAERCFRLAEGSVDKKLRDDLLAYRKELIERAEKIEATETLATEVPHDHKDQG